MTTAAQPLTEKDLEDIVSRVLNDAIDNKLAPLIQKVVSDTVGRVVGDAMQIICERFDRIDKRFDDMIARFDNLENSG